MRIDMSSRLEAPITITYPALDAVRYRLSSAGRSSSRDVRGDTRAAGKEDGVIRRRNTITGVPAEAFYLAAGKIA